MTLTYQEYLYNCSEIIIKMNRRNECKPTTVYQYLTIILYHITGRIIFNEIEAVVTATRSNFLLLEAYFADFLILRRLMRLIPTHMVYHAPMLLTYRQQWRKENP